MATIAQAHNDVAVDALRAVGQDLMGSAPQHRMSSLQDLEAGKSLELDALLGAVCELGRLVGVETPASDIINALARQRAITAGCYPAGQITG